MSETRNPYAAPTALVDDAPAPGISPFHPHVRRACILMWATFVLGLVTLPGEVKRQSVATGGGAVGGEAFQTGIVVGAVISLLITAGILWWITAKLRAGRNWMRWVLNILTVVSIALIPLLWDTFSATYGELMSRPLETAFTAIQLVLNVISLALINTPSARQWFAEMKQHTR
jgi:hypothetical protein